MLILSTTIQCFAATTTCELIQTRTTSFSMFSMNIFEMVFFLFCVLYLDLSINYWSYPFFIFFSQEVFPHIVDDMHGPGGA